MVSWGSKPTVWDGDKLTIRSSSSQADGGSKPTVWDGDSTAYPATLPVSLFGGSKPTVWDGDITTPIILIIQLTIVLSPLRGMETLLPLQP